MEAQCGFSLPLQSALPEAAHVCHAVDEPLAPDSLAHTALIGLGRQRRWSNIVKPDRVGRAQNPIAPFLCPGRGKEPVIARQRFTAIRPGSGAGAAHSQLAALLI